MIDFFSIFKSAVDVDFVVQVSPFALLPLVKVVHSKMKARQLDSILKNKVTSEYPFSLIKSVSKEYVGQYSVNSNPGNFDEPDKAIVARNGSMKIILRDFFSDNNRKYMIVLGDSGLGKTTFSMSLAFGPGARDVLKNYLLVIIDLGSSGRGLSVNEKIQSIKNKQNTLLVLDAFDEDQYAQDDPQKRLVELLSLCCGFAKVIITSRTQFFYKDSDIPDSSTVKIRSPRSIGVPVEYVLDRVYLSPFSYEDALQLLRKCFGFDIIGFFRAQRLIRRVPSLSARPMLIRYMPFIKDSNFVGGSIFGFYGAVIDQWLLRESLNSDLSILYNFSVAIAYRIAIGAEVVRSHKKTVSYYYIRTNGDLHRVIYNRISGGEDISSKINVEKIRSGCADLDLSIFYGIPLPENYTKRTAASRSLLNRTANGNYKFAHKSIMEFLLVKEILSGATSECEIRFSDMMTTFLFSALCVKYENTKSYLMLRKSFVTFIPSPHETKMRMDNLFDMYRTYPYIDDRKFVGYDVWSDMALYLWRMSRRELNRLKKKLSKANYQNSLVKDFFKEYSQADFDFLFNCSINNVLICLSSSSSGNSRQASWAQAMSNSGEHRWTPASFTLQVGIPQSRARY